MTLLETAGAGDAKGERRGADSTERIGEVVRNRPLDLADEPKGEVQLLVVLPAEVGAVVHRVDEEVADRLGWADGDEQAVHQPSILSRKVAIQRLVGAEVSGGRSSIANSRTASTSSDQRGGR